MTITGSLAVSERIERPTVLPATVFKTACHHWPTYRVRFCCQASRLQKYRLPDQGPGVKLYRARPSITSTRKFVSRRILAIVPSFSAQS